MQARPMHTRARQHPAYRAGAMNRPQSVHEWPHADTLKRLRDVHNLSMEKAAGRIGATRAGWDKWERQRQAPSPDVLRAIISEFGVPPAALGYEPPQGWELVPSEWIRQAFEQHQTALEKLEDKIDALMGMR